MTEDLRNANENLTQWGRTLEKRVEERTQELREAEDQLIRSEKLASLGKMASGVAHEINNPLTSILINASLMLETCGDGHAFLEPLTMISEETARCAEIVKGLLEFARQTPAQIAPADINDVIERTAQLIEMQASVRNVKIIKALDTSLPQIELDKNKIRQVFSNLMINAIEAMPTGGTLTITSRLNGNGRQVEILFADTGVGIPPENIQKLFDPFFTTKSFGTGLGLAVSYGIIQQRGGTIDVKSEVGRGSVFTVKLPLEETRQTNYSLKERPIMTNRPKHKILIVDDEVTVCKSIQRALLSDLYEIDMALSGEEALRKEDEKKYDVIIADLMMPGLSGLDLLQSLKAKNALAKVIMVTGYPTMKTTVQAMQIGAFDYLPKPFLPAELRLTVTRALTAAEKEKAEKPD